jgi:signal transduction histidine kinase
MNRYFYQGLKYSLYGILLILGIVFEQAPYQRFVMTVSIGIAFLISQVVKDMLLSKSKYGAYGYLIDLGLIYALDTLSKFTMNYFIQVLYLVLMIEIALLIRRKEWFFLCLTTLFVASIKLTFLIQSLSAIGSYIQLGFFVVVSIMLLFILQIFHRYRDEKDNNEALYKELFETHRRLKSSLERLQELSIVKERQRIARELHDALGHDLTTLIYRLEVVQRMDRSQEEDREALITAIKEDSRSALRRVREVVETLREERPDDGLEALKMLTDRFADQMQLPVSFCVTGLAKPLSQALESTLYRLIQEGLTNVMRHANAHQVEILLNFKTDGLEVFFRDDGSGEKDFKPGFGLKGMRERVEALSGQLEFLVDHGFVIKARFPLGGQND